jgi:hypothetical protein
MRKHAFSTVAAAGALAVALGAGACGGTGSDAPTSPAADGSGDGNADAGGGPTAPDSGSSSGEGGEGMHPDAGTPTFPRLPDVSFSALSVARGSGLALGVVTGRIYDDLVKNTEARMADLAALGVRILRLEIERATPLADYAAIVAAAARNGIEVLAVFTQSSLAAPNDPMTGTRADFDGAFVPKVIAAIDAATTAIPSLRYVELWNEPDVYAFTPFSTFSAGTCTPLEGSYRYALLAVRVFETMNERRKNGMKTPTIAAFDFSHQDDTCVLSSAADAPPIASHRAGYRPPNALPDGLPADIVSIHGYGLPNRIPGELGYTYAGGTFADGVATFLAHTFADGRRMIGSAPVWYSEVGFCLGGIGGPDPLGRQQQAVTGAMSVLRTHPEITAAFSYSYRDDEGTGGERCGLRNNSASSFSVHPAYEAYQAQATAGADVVAPGGAIEVSAANAKPGAAVHVTGWAIDADGAPPTVSIAVDGAVVSTIVDGATPHPAACTIAHSARCPNVGFAASVIAPVAAGVHEIAARALDAKGNARVLGRVALTVP